MMTFHISNIDVEIDENISIYFPIDLTNYMHIDTFVLECPLYITPSGIGFNHIFENVVLKSLKSFFQLDHETNISTSMSRRLPHSTTLRK